MRTQSKLATVILAAGKGTRMKDPSKAKVMFEVMGKPMIHYVLDVAFQIGSEQVLTIVGYQRQTVIDYVQRSHPQAKIVVQAEQLGTGHAVLQTEPLLRNFEGDILVLSGDVPLLRCESLQRLLEHHRTKRAIATILTAVVEDPTGYGRIIRSINGSVEKIVEQKDATSEELALREINSGIYVFQAAPLFEALATLQPNNAQQEYYLTDVFEYFWKKKIPVAAIDAEDESEILGVNTLEHLEMICTIMAQRVPQ